MELKDDPALFAASIQYLREQRDKAPDRAPGESEQVIKSRHMPDRRLSMADQGLQMRIRKVARSMITGRSRRLEGSE